jgi:hypothetical protein
MIKRSLFFGATAALSLLVIFAFVGCSNPTSETSSAAQLPADFDYPPGTAFAEDFGEFLGLLNDTGSLTNGVTYIAYGGNGTSITSRVIIPNGKVVYLNSGNFDDPSNNIVVAEGAKLVLLTNVVTTTGKLLVNGSLEVYGSLTMGTDAMDVADYYVEADDTIKARGTIIGTSQVLVAPRATLGLSKDDIATTPTRNRFTPAEAWAAAGQGNLIIGSEIAPLSPTYTVDLILTGVSPLPSRTYTVYTEGGAPVPSVIPRGAIITTTGQIADAPEHKLTINGTLLAKSASFASIQELIISDIDTGDFSRSTAIPDPVTSNGWLGADNATFAAAKVIHIGDYGNFVSESNGIDLPPETVITLGKSARFEASAIMNNTFAGLKALYIGPASNVVIGSGEVTFGSLETVTIKDGGSLHANAGHSITFKTDGTTATPLALTMGNRTAFLVGVNPAVAQLKQEFTTNTVITSILEPTQKSTFTVAEGVTLTLEGAGKLVIPTPDTPTAGTAPIKINGTIEFGEGASFAMADLTGTSGNAAGFIDYGPTGKIVLKPGSTAYIGETLYLDDGTASSPAARFQAGEGAVVELKDHYMGLTKGTVTLGVPEVYIQATDTIEIARGAVLDISEDIELFLISNSNGGATIKGEGKVVGGTATEGKYPTEIVGGPNGWQAKGTGDGSITLSVSSDEFTITANASTTFLTALGSGATITQNAIEDNNLTIDDSTVIDLGGTTNAKAGQIILVGDGTNPGKITFAKTSTSAIKIGSAALPANSYTSSVKIGGVTFTGDSEVQLYTTNTATPYGPGKFVGVTVSDDSKVLKGATNSPPGSSSIPVLYIDSVQDVTGN